MAPVRLHFRLVSISVIVLRFELSEFDFMSISQKRGILERLDAGEVVIGDGGFVFALEKRGYVRAGPWTPEVNVEYPSAGKFYNLT